MGRKKKSWAEKMHAKPPHSVRLEEAFAGVAKGARLLISSPQEIAQRLHAIPAGETMSIQQFRGELAKAHGCDATCPVSTLLFLRIVAEHS